MSNQTTICAKISADLKKKVSELNINASAVMREALQSEVKRKEKEKLRKLAEEAAKILQKIPTEELVESIRSSRNNR